MASRLDALSPSSWPQIARAYRYLAMAGWRIFVRREKVDTWACVNRPQDGPTPAMREQQLADRAARWTNTAARYPFPWARCLQRSFALCLWMEREGLAPTLRLGVKKAPSGIDAHAWVEYGGRIVNDSPEVGTVFAAFQSSTAGARRRKDLADS